VYQVGQILNIYIYDAIFFHTKQFVTHYNSHYCVQLLALKKNLFFIGNLLLTVPLHICTMSLVFVSQFCYFTTLCTLRNYSVLCKSYYQTMASLLTENHTFVWCHDLEYISLVLNAAVMSSIKCWKILTCCAHRDRSCVCMKLLHIAWETLCKWSVHIMCVDT